MTNQEEIKKIPVYIPVYHSDLLKGRTALVTGSTRGIGAAIAKAILNSGGKVVVTGRSKDNVAECVRALKGLEPFEQSVWGATLEMQNVAEFKLFYENVKSMAGGIDILVNNAGSLNFARFGSTTVDDFDGVINSNLRGAYMLSQIIADDWITHQIQGNILNICSSSSIRPANSPYSLSKWALRGMTLGLAKVLTPYGITVNGLAPGPTNTVGFVGKDNQNLARPRMPSGRLITEEEVANMAVVLVSSIGRMIIGDVIYMTAGCGNLTHDDCRFPFGNSLSQEG